MLGPFWITGTVAVTIFAMGPLFGVLFNRPMDTYLIKDNNFNINELITIENKLKMNKFNVNENKVIKINNNNCSCKIINESNLEMIVFIKTFYRK